MYSVFYEENYSDAEMGALGEANCLKCARVCAFVSVYARGVDRSDKGHPLVLSYSSVPRHCLNNRNNLRPLVSRLKRLPGQQQADWR